VTDGDGSPVGGQLVVGNDEPAQLIWQFTQHAERLGTERLVDFPDVNLLGRQPGALDGQRDRPRRRQSHEQWVDPVDGG
jgi:hypothetical protein